MKKLLLLVAILLLYGCPGNDDCDDIRSIARVDNLIKLTPVQTQYRQGDVITLYVQIPAINDYFGSTTNLLEQTGNSNAKLSLSTAELQNGNELMFISGYQEREINWFGLRFNNNTGRYELEIQIKLNRIGMYDIPTLDTIFFKGENCNRFLIDTNIEWTTFGQVTFEVVP
jgi:hypothetical protein